MGIGNITISITNRCNYLCRHCSFNSGEKIFSECSALEWISFLEDAKTLGAERLDISGGEPTLRKDLEIIISGASSLGYRVKLLTNGSYLTDERLRRLKDSELESIAISLDGSTSLIHNHIRLKDKSVFDQTLDAIKKSLEYGFFTKINTVVFNSNLEDIPSIIALAQSMKVNEHRICYFTPTGRGQSLLDNLDPVRWLSFMREKLAKFSDDENLYIGTSHLDNNRELETRCYVNLSTYPLHVLPNGDIYACSIQTSTANSIGNIKDGELRGHLMKVSYVNGCCFDYGFKPGSSGKELCRVCPLRKFKLKELI